jgi:phage I-like protein
MNTKLQSAAHATALPDDGSVPEWVHLIPAGRFSGRDGRGPYTLDAASVKRHFEPQAIDYEHQSSYARINGQPAPAAGWVQEIDIKPDGVWGRVEWTSRAAAHIAAKEYRFLSPVFNYEGKTGRVAALSGAALTNQPNLHLTALNRRDDGQDIQISQTKGSDMTLEELLAATETAAMKKELDLPDDADAITIIKAAHARLTAQPAQAQAESAELKLLRAEHARVQAHIATLEKEREDKRVTEAVDAALAAHKISPASRADAEALFRESPEAFAKFIAAQAPILPDSKTAEHTRGQAKGSEGNENPLVALSLKLKQEAGAR